jgi:SAM-dependent methyltransferase
MNQQYYDGLAPYYHLVHKDWEAGMARQAASLDGIMRKQWGGSISRVVDVACGIGTQTLGLSEAGYKVSASDISPVSVERAAAEARRKGLDATFGVADMKNATQQHGGDHDIVICCDNSLAHLLSDEEILSAFREFYKCVRPGGACLVSVRDYDLVKKSGSRTRSHGVREENGTRYRLFQVWEFDGELHDVSMYVIVDDGSGPEQVNVFRTRYYAVSPNRLVELMREAGFSDVKRIDRQYFQPVIVGTRPKAC